MPGNEQIRRIRLRGVRTHNLKSVDLDLPHHQLIVLTGVSGSGKSSLAFDTLYAEGQRRYIETFSTYTRQFLETLDKPDADRIEGIPPAIAVSQWQSRRSGRSTVGSITEIHDYLALLYAHAGRVICKHCGTEVRPAGPPEVVRAIEQLPERTRYQIAFPVELTTDTNLDALAGSLREDGFVRILVDGQAIMLGSGPVPLPQNGRTIDVIVDRLVRGADDPSRRIDSIETAFDKGDGRCRLLTELELGDRTFERAWRCSTCGAAYIAPEPRLFRPNSPLGACPACEGLGRVIDFDMARIVPDPSKSLAEGAIAPWTTPKHRVRLQQLLDAAPRLGLPTDQPFRVLTLDQVKLVVEGPPALSASGSSSASSNASRTRCTIGSS